MIIRDLTVVWTICYDHPDVQELEFLEGPDGQKNRICSDYPDGQNVMTIRMVRSHDHPDGQELEFLEGLDGQELEFPEGLDGHELECS